MTSRARDREELVTDDATALRETLEAVTGERISAREGIGKTVRPEREREGKAPREREGPDRGKAAPTSPGREVRREPSRNKVPKPEPPARGKLVEMDLGL